MPDVVRLRYLGDTTAAVPALGRTVAPEQLVDVPGRVLTAKADFDSFGLTPAPDDAIAVAVGNPAEVRLFPKTTWRDETPAARPKSKGE